jgi:hypothetical protein
MLFSMDFFSIAHILFWQRKTLERGHDTWMEYFYMVDG